MISFGLLFLVVFLLFVFIFLVIPSIRTKPPIKDFDSIVKIFVFLMLFHCLLIYIDIVIPIALLYGPIHLHLNRLSQQKSERKFLYIELLPFFLLSIFYCVTVYSVKSDSAWGDSFLIYYPIHYLCVMISSFGYGAYIWFAKRSSNYLKNQVQLVLQLATIAFIIGVFILMLFLSKIKVGKIDKESLGFDPIFIVIGLMLFSVCIMISFLSARNESENEENIERLVRSVKAGNAGYSSSNVGSSLLKEYALLLEKTINDKKLYLFSALSLDDLLVETGIPKHHLSQVFNIYLGKTFYQYLAERRIKEAVFRIDSEDNLTLESLAYECGFNSKTSFNRYFKNIMGMTPSEYRKNSETVSEN